MNQFHCFEIIDIFDVYIHVYNKMKKQFLTSKEEKLFVVCLFLWICFKQKDSQNDFLTLYAWK